MNDLWQQFSQWYLSVLGDGGYPLIAALMAVGFFAALLYLTRGFQRSDLGLLTALYFILLELLIMTSVALLFSTFSSPLLSSIFAFSIFVIGTFGEDLHRFAATARGPAKLVLTATAYVFPNFGPLNVISQVAHEQAVGLSLVTANTLYALTYSGAMLLLAAAIFQNRNLK